MRIVRGDQLRELRQGVAMGSRSLVIAVDLGGTQIRAALCDLQGRFLRRAECPTGAADGLEAVLGRIVDLVEQVRAGAPGDSVLGVGIGSPGPVDALAGVIISPPNLPGWYEVPLRALLEERLQLPVRVANDANASALGEWAFGAGRGYRNVAYVTISTGIGGGIIADGRLLLGHRGLAGEVGHMTLEPDGPRCNCGNYGCWEALSSGTAIAREGAEAVRAGRAPILSRLVKGVAERVDAKLVGEAEAQGDKAAAEIIRRAAEYSGVGVANLLHLYSPEIVLIGGGVS
ncbi:MAG: ROK family protein, partial [Chloroflexia bacterium]